MKLLRVVNLLQKVRAERLDLEAAARAGAGIAWSHCERRLEVEPAPGQFVAYDVTIVGMSGEVPLWKTAERLTEDRDDYGLVYDALGEVVGRVESIRNGLVTLSIAGGLSEAEVASRGGGADGAGPMPEDWIPA